MKKIKKEYVKPDISVTQVEVESALCGSAGINNPNNPENGRIENQTINQEFDNGGWIAPSDGVGGNTTGAWSSVTTSE